MNIDKRHPLRVRQGPRLANRLAHAVVTTAGVALLVAGLIFDAFVYFSLRSAPGAGTTIRGTLPVPASEVAAD